MNPKHIENITDPQRIAIAPYNFVKLPEQVVTVSPESLPQENRYYSQSENRYTGKIECTLTTESPLYIRCGLTVEEFREKKESKDSPDFFYTNSLEKATKPVIPGSSLRGMLRNLVEIVSFGKIVKVTDKKPFYRSLADQALKEIYHLNFIEDSELTHWNNLSKHVPCYHSKVCAGFLYKQKNSYTIKQCGYGRIHFDLHNPKKSIISDLSHSQLYQGRGPGKNAQWEYQHRTIYVEIDDREKNYPFPSQQKVDNKTGHKIYKRNGQPDLRHDDLYLRFRKVHTASFTPAPGLQKATLVITGDMQHKHLEFVFLDENLKEYSVLEEMIRRFQDDDQITKWQQDAFPEDKPTAKCRQKKGLLRDGEPVFFLLNDDGEVRFFGRAQMFRLPYDLSPLDLVPEELRKSSDMDIAEAIFGYVDGELPRDKARAGRIFVGDATCISSGNVWWKNDFEQTVTPKILSSPKPTTFQHYLVQTNTHPKQLKHYSPQSEQEKTVIRGHKLYWHKPHGTEEIEETDETKIEKARLQYTQIKPLKAGISFKFDIHFENLSNVELGALLWVLSLSSDKSQILETGKPGEKYCFSLGMGKPLGMGAVKIDYELYLSDRTSHYSNLFNGDRWKTGEENQAETAKHEKDCVKAFEDFMFDSKNGISDKDRERPDKTKATSLKTTPRIEMLLAMLRCDRTPNTNLTRYMTIEAREYQNRPVLPTPLQVWKDNLKLDNSPSSPSISGGYGATSSGSGSTPKPILKGQDKGKPIKKGQQSQQQQKPKGNSEGNNPNPFARPPKPNR